MAYDIGPRIGIEGEKEFRQAIQGINTNLKTLSTEMLAVTSQFDRNDKSMAALTSQNKVLNKQIDEQKTKLSELEKGLKASAEKYGENDKVTQGWQQAVNKATADLNKMQRELNDNTAAMAKLSDGGLNFSEKMKKASVGLKDFGEKVGDLGKTMATTVTAPIMAAGGAAFKFAADLQDAVGAANQVFKGSSGTVQAWADSLNSAYGIAETEALTYANTMGAMLQNIGGLTEQEAAKQSQTLVELAGDMTAMFGGTTESAIQALTGALKGNNAMLDNYGMGVNDATIKTKALQMGLYDGTGQMDLATKQAATLALIMEQTADVQGQAAREANGASGSLRGLGTKLKNIATDLGKILLPIITPFIQKLGEMVTHFKNLSPETKEMIVQIAGMAAAIGPALLVASKLSLGLSSVIDKVQLAKEALGAGKGLAGVLTAIAGPAGPVLAAVAVIGVLVAAGVALYKNWDTVTYHVKNAVAGLDYAFNIGFNNIKIWVFNSINSIINRLQDLVGWLPVVGTALDNLQNKANNVINEAEQAKQTATLEYENAKRINSLSLVADTIKEQNDEMINDLQKEKFERADWARSVNKSSQSVADTVVSNNETMKSSSKSLTDTVADNLQKISSFINSTTDIIYKKLELWRLQNDLTTESNEYLTEQLKAQQQEQELLTQEITATEQALAKAIIQYGEGSDKVLEYKNKLLDLQIEQAKLTDSIDETTKSLSGMADIQARIAKIDSQSDSERSASRSQSQKEKDNFYRANKTEIDAISKRQGVDLGVAQEMLRDNLYSGIPKYARGTKNHPGGLAILGELGPELVNLPRGSQVYSNQESKNMVRPINLSLNIGTLIADDYGLKQLERKLKDIRIGEDMRLGMA